ncbi:MAG TPA: hypothetical protein VFA64_15005 [Hyphomicrobiaceae bacterium]|nr:hypothetical protein [Hyphomicrobiaceae bacterium]
MGALASDTWPWLALAGLGAFHGLNPGMGWLFAVALGLHRGDRRIVWLSPLAIAAGHALSVAAVAAAFVWAGLVIDAGVVRVLAGLLLVGWAGYHWAYGHRHRVRFGMQVGLVGLAAWSFAMATAHGAGLMLWPALMPLCLRTGTETAAIGPMAAAVAGVGVHTLAMLIVTTAIAVAVHAWLDLAILKRAWINLDLLWTAGLLAAGAWLLLAG